MKIVPQQCIPKNRDKIGNGAESKIAPQSRKETQENSTSASSAPLR